ncbi:hypothetical protein ES703_71544 [subsurface metagenome]
MLVAAVAGIYHRDTGVVGNHPGGSFPGVPDDDNISIAPHHPRHIGDAFALSQRACPDIRDSDDPAPEPVHGGLEGEPGPGAWLKKQAGHNLAAAYAQLLLHGG